VSNEMPVSVKANGALSGLKILDLSRVLAGPYCTMILADHGANVIKVEPEAGDEARAWGPPFDERCKGSSYFVGLNRNKRSITLDLKSEDGRAHLKNLLQDADILIENFKPGTMERWGLSYTELAKQFPSLIYCRISGFGADGPLGGLAGYDAILQAMSGLMSINGTEETGATKVGSPIVDLSTGLYSVISILMAVNERWRSGKGQFIDMTLHDCALAVLHPHAANFFMNGRRPKPMGNSHPNLAPCEKFSTRTGEIFIAIGNDGQFRKLASILGQPEMSDDERFLNNSARVKNAEVLFDELQAIFADCDGEAVGRELLAAGVPAGPVMSVDAALQSDHALERSMILEGPHYKGVGSPIKFSRSTSGLRRNPPAHAEHQDLLLQKSYWEERSDEIVQVDSSSGVAGE